jgi:hypothetical protein
MQLLAKQEYATWNDVISKIRTESETKHNSFREPLPKCGYCFHSHCCIHLKSALGKGVTQKCRKECRIAQLVTQLARLMLGVVVPF